YSALAAREQPARLGESALLESEVDRLGDPSAYLGATPQSAAAFDLLLGCQAWRRFQDARRDAAPSHAGADAEAGRIAMGDPLEVAWPAVLPELPGQAAPLLSSRHHV